MAQITDVIQINQTVPENITSLPEHLGYLKRFQGFLAAPIEFHMRA